MTLLQVVMTQGGWKRAFMAEAATIDVGNGTIVRVAVAAGELLVLVGDECVYSELLDVDA